jgi:hypothetical protein
MSRLAQNHIKHKGKIANRVHITDGKYKDHTRSLPAFTAKESIAAMKGQFSRTEFLNKLGSEINKIIGGYAGKLKSEDFYRRMQSRFRKESGDNRYLLLRHLKDMEIHERYITKDLAGYEFETTIGLNEISIELKTTHHYQKTIEGTNCYSFNLILIAWSPDENIDVIHFRKKSRWIKITEECRDFIFNFPIDKPVSQWLLCIGQHIGRNGIKDITLPSQGMKIVHAGTFLQEDLEVLEKSKLEKVNTSRKSKFPEFPDDDETVQAIGDEP